MWPRHFLEVFSQSISNGFRFERHLWIQVSGDFLNQACILKKKQNRLNSPLKKPSRTCLAGVCNLYKENYNFQWGKYAFLNCHAIFLPRLWLLGLLEIFSYMQKYLFLIYNGLFRCSLSVCKYQSNTAKCTKPARFHEKWPLRGRIMCMNYTKCGFSHFISKDF